MEEETAGTAVMLDRASRATRGKRMTKLVDEELEADEEFWGQDAFKEVGEDEEYEAEDEAVDEFDSDFDEDEANIEEEETQEEDERVKRKKLLPPGSKPVKKVGKELTPKAKDLDAIEAAVAAAMIPLDDEQEIVRESDSCKEAILQEEVHDFVEDPESEKTVRKSTRTAVVVRQAEREALRAAMHVSTIKPVKKKREGERRITQEDMLLEAAQTEILNHQNLERMLAREEEVKQKAIIHKTVYSGPTIRFYSRDGNNYLEFIGDIPEAEKLFMPVTKPSMRKSMKCVVTGLPAKYIDPLTGFPYATKEAFRLIRKRVEKGEPSQKKVTPGKKRRSERVIAGRSHSRTPRSAHKSISRRLLSRIKARHVDFNVDSDEEIQEPSAPELSQRYSLLAQPIRGLKPQGSSMPSASASKQLLDENRASALKTLDESKKTENLSEGARQPQKAAEELVWVEIPPPREEPMDEDYLLDDLTSLDFGPILALEHGVRVDLQDQDEHEIGDPTLGPLALSDFSTNLAF